MTIDTKALADAAFAAMEVSYAPYSHYRVGAALLTEEGNVYAAGNVENASYGLTVCAERAAVFKAISEGERDFVAIYVAADGDEAPWPCGACRQVLGEFAPDIIVYAQRRAGKIHMRTLSQLLPKAFSLGREA
jgi:cytidine deaminase